MKDEIDPYELCSGLPEEIGAFLEYAECLEF